MRAFYLTKRRIDALMPAGTAPWVMHDIRRTVATGMAKLGINLPVIEKLLNHVFRQLRRYRGVYQRHSFADEKRTAMDAWAQHVEAMKQKLIKRGAEQRRAETHTFYVRGAVDRVSMTNILSKLRGECAFLFIPYWKRKLVMDTQINEPIGALIPRKRLAEDLGVCPRTVVNLQRKTRYFRNQ